jgi:hypothetical protein
MPFTYDVDISRKTPGGVPYSEHVADYVILANATEVQLPNGRVKYTDHQRYYVQHGKIYLGGADEVNPADAPAWFWEQFERLTPASRKAVGLVLPQDRIQSADQLPADFLRQLQELPADVKAQLLGVAAEEQKRPKDAAHTLYILDEEVQCTPEDLALRDAFEAMLAKHDPNYREKLQEADALLGYRAKAPRIGKQADYNENKAPKTPPPSTDESLVSESKIDACRDPRIKIWLCDECGEETLLRHKGVHKAGHARAAKRAQKD